MALGASAFKLQATAAQVYGSRLLGPVEAHQHTTRTDTPDAFSTQGGVFVGGALQPP
jgi:hypothetical protein